MQTVDDRSFPIWGLLWLIIQLGLILLFGLETISHAKSLFPAGVAEALQYFFFMNQMVTNLRLLRLPLGVVGLVYSICRKNMLRREHQILYWWLLATSATNAILGSTIYIMLIAVMIAFR